MTQLWHGKRWTEEEIDAIAKEAVRKKYEADAAMAAAADIEVEYWHRELIERFPELGSEFDENTFCLKATRTWPLDKSFLCEVMWDDNTKETCVISEPTCKFHCGTIDYPHAVVKVWWQRAKKGKKLEFLKDWHQMRCSEIIPRITKLEPVAKHDDGEIDGEKGAEKQKAEE